MSKYLCPYCQTTFTLNQDSYTIYTPTFSRPDLSDHPSIQSQRPYESEIELKYFLCSECESYSVEINGLGSKVSEINFRALPFGPAKEFPPYIPEAIRNDYREACLIKDLSPKAAATLARRCLQGMIRDFWGVSERTLYDEITSLKNKIPAIQWRVLDSVRRIGNIGAHMEKDINTIVDIDMDEADRLIKLIEYLLENWYVNQYETEKLFKEIMHIDDKKQKQKRGALDV